jgi:hypothetical protein
MGDVMKVMWFSGRSCVGIVRVLSEYDGIQYYIGSPPFSEFSPNREEDDIQWIADWGARFPKEVGDVLFDGDPLRNGSTVVIKEHFRKAAPKPKCSVCGTTENVRYTGGWKQPYLCNSIDCIPF